IANKGDGVPQVPPVFAGDEAFNHVNTGYLISPDQAPSQLPTEIGTTPPPHGLPTLGEWVKHAPWAYHDSMLKALGG
ncbi:hypothetical protein FRC07_004254, partial [Ceratobasidium sp. 392]